MENHPHFLLFIVSIENWKKETPLITEKVFRIRGSSDLIGWNLVPLLMINQLAHGELAG